MHCQGIVLCITEVDACKIRRNWRFPSRWILSMRCAPVPQHAYKVNRLIVGFGSAQFPQKHKLLDNRSFVPEQYRQYHRNKKCPRCITRQITRNPFFQFFEWFAFPSEANMVEEYPRQADQEKQI